MSNPRPCICGHPASHHPWSTGQDMCFGYVPAKRKEPLRAVRIMHVPNTNSGITPYELRPPVDLSGIHIQSPEVKWEGPEGVLSREEVERMAARISKQVTVKVFDRIRRDLRLR